jgi:hypothetical protein
MAKLGLVSQPVALALLLTSKIIARGYPQPAQPVDQHLRAGRPDRRGSA